MHWSVIFKAMLFSLQAAVGFLIPGRAGDAPVDAHAARDLANFAAAKLEP
jgi:hypothetical protein